MPYNVLQILGPAITLSRTSSEITDTQYHLLFPKCELCNVLGVEWKATGVYTVHCSLSLGLHILAAMRTHHTLPYNEM